MPPGRPLRAERRSEAVRALAEEALADHEGYRRYLVCAPGASPNRIPPRAREQMRDAAADRLPWLDHHRFDVRLAALTRGE